MKLPKHVFFENLLSAEECDILNVNFLNIVKDGWNHRDLIGICIMNPYKQFDFNEDQIVQRLTESVQSEYPEKIKYSHSFMRLYRNNGILKLHTDRKGLDLTLSINIGGLDSWPIHISNVYTEQVIDGYHKHIAHNSGIPISKEDENIESEFKKDFSSFITPKGCGVACYARNFPHWRDLLVCKPNEYVLQIFYHWTILE